MSSDVLRTEVTSRIMSARTALGLGDSTRAWQLLEQAHVLSQPLAWPHIKVHGAMLHVAVVTRDLREFAGQVARIMLAGPGSLAGRYPVGNSGRARVSAFTPNAIDTELQAILDQAAGADRGGTR